MSKEPYVREFKLPDGSPFTAVVLDLDDYNAMIDELGELYVRDRATNNAPTPAQLAALKAAKHLPLMKRGTKTQRFFERWNVKTDVLGVMVRGRGKELVAEIVQDMTKQN